MLVKTVHMPLKLQMRLTLQKKETIFPYLVSECCVDIRTLLAVTQAENLISICNSTAAKLNKNTRADNRYW